MKLFRKQKQTSQSHAHPKLAFYGWRTSFNSRLLALLSGLLSSSNLYSAQEDEERIYQIEVIIFERTVKTESIDPEIWSKNLNLAYPINREKLQDPTETIEANSTKENPSNSMGLSTTFLQSIARTTPRASTSEAIDANNTVNNSNPADANSSTGSLPESTASEPEFLVYLADNKKTLAPQQKALDKTRGLRTIFHQAWIQSLTSPEKTTALMIHGGTRYGKHHELEGTINLSVNRYLHIQTDLWLTSFVPNYGQLSEHWPSLPSQEKQYFWSNPVTEIISNANNNSFPQLETFDKLSNSSINTTYSTETEDIATPSEPEYLIKEIITLRQARKMRSSELHYIDHPRLGLLIKIIPYEPNNDA